MLRRESVYRKLNLRGVAWIFIENHYGQCGSRGIQRGVATEQIGIAVFVAETEVLANVLCFPS